LGRRLQKAASVKLKTATLIALVLVSLYTGSRIYTFIDTLKMIGQRTGGMAGNVAFMVNSVLGILAEGSLALFLLAM